ncbi:MAG TPA: hypothetical protein ENI92_01830 [Bacteroidetes bacterium]|nr:hypothetical protein [Bacteroidota bacterium]
MSPTIDMNEHRMPTLDEIETDLNHWQNRLEAWAERIPWVDPEQHDTAMAVARFIRQLVAECWIHTIAAKSRGGDAMDPAAFRARRIHRQLLAYGPSLALRMEERLPEAIPNLAA